jgi:hypothetical protein
MLVDLRITLKVLQPSRVQLKWAFLLRKSFRTARKNYGTSNARLTVKLKRLATL